MFKNKISREEHDEMLRETRKLKEKQEIVEHFDKSLDHVVKTISVSIDALKDDVREVKDEIKKHSDSIDTINKDKIRMEDSIKHLSEKIEKQEVKNDKTKSWVVGLAGAVIIYIIQHLLSIPGLFQ